MPALGIERTSVARADQLATEVLVGDMTGIADDHDLGPPPHVLELPCVRNGRLEVEAPVHEDTENLSQPLTEMIPSFSVQ